jgi:hypothetical protein
MRHLLVRGGGRCGSVRRDMNRVVVTSSTSPRFRRSDRRGERGGLFFTRLLRGIEASMSAFDSLAQSLWLGFHQFQCYLWLIGEHCLGGLQWQHRVMGWIVSLWRDYCWLPRSSPVSSG